MRSRGAAGAGGQRAPPLWEYEPPRVPPGSQEAAIPDWQGALYGQNRQGMICCGCSSPTLQQFPGQRARSYEDPRLPPQPPQPRVCGLAEHTFWLQAAEKQSGGNSRSPKEGPQPDREAGTKAGPSEERSETAGSEQKAGEPSAGKNLPLAA